MPRTCRPVHLGEPASEPVPVAGCDVCRALADQRARAYASGDKSKASDCNVEMIRHSHPKAR
ncbi:hypothetical protein SNA_37650 [Streptomyces natalensis ATCC 27448]|uniref:Uncharacterized protein n=1 Tax=Streptomyces natalensis ATCC 27448 TaxID=1240678 RepID=A0A0D7CEC4_9ACTN|nr:hypothetical protein [Streptomyces natalensis]KIZ13727.1 hypothetical protein SNA_37650 [Streptomyces natalensis ATCC 27448]